MDSFEPNQNNVLDNIDFQQEKREEMLQVAKEQERECCVICGKPLTTSQYVYKRHDSAYACEQCQLDEISNDCVVWGDVLEAERDRKATQEVF
ncbi:hypothetical protein ACWG0P_07290 [Amedibacillus sp. YH-ame6]